MTDGNVGRIIDMRWLQTNAARFRLGGVVMGAGFGASEEE